MARDSITIMQQSQHHNIVRLEDYFESKEHIYLCLELHSNMTLFEYINKYNYDIEETRAQELGRKVGRALEYLHDNGIVLKNLESQGILMTEAGERDMLEKAVPRISRLDNSEIMGYESHCHSIFGDIRFRAPEVLAGKHYDFKADAWSFGIILFQILTGHLPFDRSNVIREQGSKKDKYVPPRTDYPEPEIHPVIED
jgi:carbon catabolite-derepressing protein kinase